MERVIGYKEVEVNVVTSHPCEWDGKTGPNGFKDLKPCTQTRILLRPIYEQLGPKLNTTLEDPIAGIPETPLWGVNTDDATGKHRKK